MPYIKMDERRDCLRAGAFAESAGELNFQIASYLKSCIENKSDFDIVLIETFVKNFLGNKPNYQRYNDMTGCLIRCDKEVKRRFNVLWTPLIYIMNSYDDEIAEYEDVKIIENGDI